VVNVVEATEEDEVMILTHGGMAIRCPMQQVRMIGRATQGVRVINLEEGDRVVAIAGIAKEILDEEVEADAAKAAAKAAAPKPENAGETPEDPEDEKEQPEEDEEK